ncbi:MAG: transposase, partial [Chitinophagales bacterium]|nr:transposase [Chitinophagales bacterium]
MQGRKKYQPKTMYLVQLHSLVPENNFYRKLDETLNLGFLYEQTAACYGTEGQSSIDPVVFFKICLVGYLNNINSDRKLIEYCSDSLAVRLYLRYDIDEILPWHSTISRTRQLYGEEIFLSLFKEILRLCVEKGMVKGKRQSVDSAYIKANASMDSLIEKEVLEDAEYYAQELKENKDNQVSESKKKHVEQHHNWKKKAYKDMPANTNGKQTDEQGNLIRPKFVSNHTHYSPTDRDARVSVKPGKVRQLNFSGQIAVDDKHHVITGALADFADKRDSQSLEKIVEQSKQNLEEQNLELKQIIADAGYSSGEALQYLEKQGIDGWIPNFGQYKPEREGFIFNKEVNQYECIKTGGNKAIIPFRKETTDSKGYTKKVYRSTNEKCKNCPLRALCIGKSDFKKIEDSIYKPYYDRMHQKRTQNPQYATRMSRIRSSTVEPV